MIKKYLHKLFVVCLLVFLSGNAIAQGRTISGMVIDETGQPVVGAGVVVKGTTQGVITGMNGEYSIQVPSNATLVFSFVGMGEREVLVGARSRVDVTMSEVVNELSDVVVIGYGTVRKRDLTGAVASVRGNDITAVPTSNPMDAIQGKVAGMDIVQSSGKAGAGVDIRIRGNRSIMGSNDNTDRNKPLFIIDGVGGGSYEDLNPNDIESIEVLKDASSTAIYGSQGANGVVLITTKKGIKGQTRVVYDGYFGVNGLAEYPEPRIGDAYMQLRRDGWRNRNNWAPAASDDQIFTNQSELTAMQNGEWVNWVDQMQRNATQQSHSVSVRSGGEKNQTFMSINYYDEGGTVKYNDAQRITARLNIDQNINKWAKAGMYSQYTYWNINNRSESVLKNALSSRPYGLAYDDDGKINMYPVSGMESSYKTPMLDEYAAQQGISNENNVLRHRLSLSAYAEITPIEGLKLTSNLGTNVSFERTGIYQDSISTDIALTGPNRAEYNTSMGQSLKWENILTFKRTFADIHALTFIGVYSENWSISEAGKMSGKNLLIPTQLYYNMGGLQQTTLVESSSYVKSTMTSFATRVEYGLMDKYLFMASVRWDGASRIPNHWDYFPAASAAWRISDENFMQNVSQVNDLKLRVSYGVTGNSGIDVYGSQSLAGNIVDKFAFGDVGASTYGFGSTIGNNGLRWEKTASVDLGLDVSLFKNRVNLTLDFYNSNTYDVLLKRTAATISGGSGSTVFDTYQNIAKTNNKGVEVTLNTVNVEKAGFRWTSMLTFSKNIEEITELYDGLSQIINSTGNLVVGSPIKSFYGYNKIGIWQESEATLAATYNQKPGDIRVEDKNGDGKIDANDQFVIGSQVPSWIGGFNTTFTYKGFDLTASFVMRWGQMIQAEFLGRYDPEGVNNGPGYLEYWTPETPTNDYPAPGYASTAYLYFNTLQYVDGSYFKFRTLTLGYTLPAKYARQVKLEKLRVYVTGNNLFTKAKSHLIQYYDPERGGSEKTPLSKQFIVGLSLEF